MKKCLLVAVGSLSCSYAFCEDAKTPFAQNLEAVASIAWPLVALVLIVALYPQIKTLLKSNKLSFKVAGMELTAEQATTQITKHILDLENKLMELKCQVDDASGKEIIMRPGIKSKDWRILWVTEDHANHAFEIAFLERDGVEVLKASTTKEAMEILKEEEASIDAIITGVSRKENNIENRKAGFDLLRKVKSAGYKTEVFVMCSPANIKQYYEQLITAGAKDATSSPLSLLGFLKEEGLNCPRQQKALSKMKNNVVTVAM